MQYSLIIKSVKYLFIIISIVIFSFLAFKTIPAQKKNENVVSFESERFSSASQILSNPLFMGLDKKKNHLKYQPLKLQDSTIIKMNLILKTQKVK